MLDFTLDTYYDVTCSHCSRKRSVDFGKGKWSSGTPYNFEMQIHSEGWRVINNKNVCPHCNNLINDPAWVSVGVKSPPVDTHWTGINSATKRKYRCFTKEGHTVYGYIYQNNYSCSGYAVYLGEDDYVNNVTHWVPDETVWDEDK